MTEPGHTRPPSTNELPWVMEALLFVAEEPQPLPALARAAGVSDAAARKALNQLAADYEARGLRVLEDSQRYQLGAAPEFAPYIENMLGTGPGQRLTRAALETLTIIAYKQPCTRAEIEAIRGVNSDRLVAILEQRGLIDNVGTGDGPGRPKLYRTTMRFLEHFGIKSPRELPPLPEPQEETPIEAEI
ncbi:MAG: SMC-Scp complex subunit ScpB [Chloroflexi bacterium]|nr:SMC-Scp complex subunit ScpB [Dehalococcoidia bacterium]MCO5201212.1 SMC-Scp complex subunit ScpB [Chloroflexota bacterium]MCZ7577978.1 SMC-Scp complex subunit ScpB [Dehalococcoidia bacterium]PWB48860.1 MAG: SMC-Scp complex subunit ScpB [Dehalococcoidia bacterium]